MELDTPSGYIPSSIAGITTGRIDWVIVQFQIHKEEDKITATFRNIGSSTRTATVNIIVSFLKCGQHSISHYSTTETSTGKTWIDGKPIYRKVIEFGAMSGNNRYTKAHGISYDTIVSFNAIARNSTNSYLPLARVGYNSDNQIDASLNGYAYITPDAAIIIGGSQTNYTGATVIIEYTKA